MTVLRPALFGAAAAGTAASLATRLPAPWRVRWERRNFRGQPVTLLEGPAVVIGLAGGALMAGHPVGAAAAVGAGALGVLDDLGGSNEHKGLRGHLRAMSRGQVTTGGIKVVGLALLGLGVAAVTRPSRAHQSMPARAMSVAVAGALVAGSANVVNLFDLRPGRALKASLAVATPLALAGSGPAGAAVGAALSVLPADLRGTSMLGDTGANALGAVLGYAAVRRLPLPAQTGALALVTALTLASERVSFSTVIERTPWLDRVDRWGRRD